MHLHHSHWLIWASFDACCFHGFNLSNQLTHFNGPISFVSCLWPPSISFKILKFFQPKLGDRILIITFVSASSFRCPSLLGRLWFLLTHQTMLWQLWAFFFVVAHLTLSISKACQSFTTISSSLSFNHLKPIGLVECEN